MPGPSNKKKRKPAQKNKNLKDNSKNAQNSVDKSRLEVERIGRDQREADATRSLPSSSSSRSPSQQPRTPPPVGYRAYDELSHSKDSDNQQFAWNPISFENDYDEWSRFAPLPPMPPIPIPVPYIHDPGNGPRVRDARAFLSSTYFAEKPALHDPLCAEFSQPEIVEMLRTILPEETALILWYNKSRATSRICPACQRLYRLGDKLPDLISETSDEPQEKQQEDCPNLRREQDISGLCSPVCFILASFNFPGAIKQAWGRMADEIDDDTWEIMNGPGLGVRPGMGAEDTSGKMGELGTLGKALGMLVRMTRLHDLGLGQLCFEDSPLQGEVGDVEEVSVEKLVIS